MTTANAIRRHLPHFASGPVIKGFGRGSKELGIPTANFPESVIDDLPQELQTGIYFGWAKIDDGSIEKMVMSVGWNPYYKNEKRSMETHIIKKFQEDFYGSFLRVVICGYIRPEENYKSLDELIKAIQSDIAFAEKELEEEEFLSLKMNNFFSNDREPTPSDCSSVER